MSKKRLSGSYKETFQDMKRCVSLTVIKYVLPNFQERHHYFFNLNFIDYFILKIWIFALFGSFD